MRWISLALALGAVTIGDTPSRRSTHPTPAETRAELEAVCRRLTEGTNPFFGEQVVEGLKQRVQATDAASETAVRLRGRLGHELIRLGKLEDAIRVLDEALALHDGRDPESPGSGDLRGLLLRTLAIAHLQLGEDENCVARHTATSCLLPVTDEAVHALPAHASLAGDLLERYLDSEPDEPMVRWLLNLARMVSGDYPDGVPEPHRLPADALAGSSFPRWRDIAPELGVNAFDLAGGAVMDDFDGDGLLDLVTSSWHPCEPMKAFRNDGRGGFENVTRAWGLDGQLGGLNLVHADFDDDDRLDLLVLRGAWLGEEGRIRNSLLRNEIGGASGRFVDVTAAAGLAYPAYPTQTAAWADYDGDGDLDLYVGNEATASSTDPLQLFGRTGNSYPSQLFRNNGDGTFTDVARAAGVTDQRFAKGVAWGDFDDDGDPDLYVSNIGPNRLFRNDGDGTFTDVATELGVVEPSGVSFATWFFDFDNDGDLDLFVADYGSPVGKISAAYLGLPTEGGHPLIYRNDGGGFTEVATELGLTRPLLPMGANYGDLDHDGWPDVYLGTGVPDFEALMPGVMYRNDRGRALQDVTFTGGFGHLQKGHGVAFGDLDNDGDQDLFHQLGGAYPFDAYGNALFENPGSESAWVTLRLEGRRANRWGMGARISVRVDGPDGPRTIHALAGSGGSFGGSSLQQEIGLGRATGIDSILIRWPGSKTRQELRDVSLNHFYRVIEGEPELVRLDLPRIDLGRTAQAASDHGHSR